MFQKHPFELARQSDQIIMKIGRSLTVMFIAYMFEFSRISTYSGLHYVFFFITCQMKYKCDGKLHSYAQNQDDLPTHLRTLQKLGVTSAPMFCTLVQNAIRFDFLTQNVNINWAFSFCVSQNRNSIHCREKKMRYVCSIRSRDRSPTLKIMTDFIKDKNSTLRSRITRSFVPVL